MKDIWIWVQSAFAAIGGTLGWYLGGLDGFLYALIAFVTVDYITGVLRAIVEKKLSSRIGAHGIAKKVALFLVVGIGHLIDTYLLGGTGTPLRTAVIFFYIANEGVSLLENATAMGTQCVLHGKTAHAPKAGRRKCVMRRQRERGNGVK